MEDQNVVSNPGRSWVGLVSSARGVGTDNMLYSLCKDNLKFITKIEKQTS